MSWDIELIKTANNNEEMEDIDESVIVGLSKADVISNIVANFPEIDTEDDSWLIFESGNVSFEVNTGSEDTADTVVFMINELDDEADFLRKLKQICSSLDCRAFDTTRGEFI